MEAFWKWSSGTRTPDLLGAMRDGISVIQARYSAF